MEMVDGRTTIGTLFKDLLQNAWPIKAKFHVELLWVGGTKVCLQHPGHMTKMATMPTL